MTASLMTFAFMPTSIMIRKALFSIVLLTTCFAACRAQTRRSDIIGEYRLDEDTAKVGDPQFCPINLTVSSFAFEVRTAPEKVFAPSRFNIFISHLETKVAGRPCKSSGSIQATESGHPFAVDVTGVLSSWTKGGFGSAAKWLPETFVDEVAKQSWNVGYDFNERTCGNIRLRAGIGYLWFEPGWNILIGNAFQLKGGTKYLLLTFQGDPRSACVYKAHKVGGQGNFPVGPVSDPSIEAAGGTPTTEPPTTTEAVSTTATTTATTTTIAITPVATTSPEAVEEEDEGEDEPPENETGGGQGNVFLPGEGDDGDDDPLCFPADARVQLDSGDSVEMARLEVGHKALVNHNQHSDVYFFSHRTDKGVHEYVTLRTESGHKVTMSANHYVHVDGSLKAAGSVQIGDALTLANGEKSSVVDVSVVMRQGKFAPHTLHGDLIVDGVLVSTYTTAVHPSLAHHVLLRPVRWLYRSGLSYLVQGILEDGSDWLRWRMPRGDKVARRVV